MESTSARQGIYIFLGIILLGLLIGYLSRDVPILGYDWVNMFSGNLATDIYYPPWTSIVLRPFADLPVQLGLSLINGITVSAVAFTTYMQGRYNTTGWRFTAVIMALFSCQTLVVVWTGHIDGLALLGLWALPWAVPMVLMKSTFIGFAVLTRKDWTLAALGFVIITFVIWPGWPNDLITTLEFRNTHPAAAGWERTGFLPVVLGILLFFNTNRRDIFQNMAVGALVYPFIMPYHHLVLLPALGELKGLRLIMVWIAAWLMILPAGLERFHHIYFLFPLFLWWYRRSDHKGQTWLEFLAEISKSVRSRVLHAFSADELS